MISHQKNSAPTNKFVHLRVDDPYWFPASWMYFLFLIRIWLCQYGSSELRFARGGSPAHMFTDFGYQFFVGALVLWENSCWCTNGGASLCCLHYLWALLNSREGVRSGGNYKQTKKIKSAYAQIRLPAEVIQVARGSSRTGRNCRQFWGGSPSAQHTPRPYKKHL